MGRMQIIVDDLIEKDFRLSLGFIKKGDISKKIESLMKQDLKNSKLELKKEMKLVKKLFGKGDKLILKLYEAEECSILAVNKFTIEWDKLKKEILKNKK
jgi:hypothetical protein